MKRQEPKQPTALTMDALTKALGDALRDPAALKAGGMTAAEISYRLGWGIGRVRTALRQLHRKGQLMLQRGLRPAIDGTERYVPLYSVRPRTKGDK